MIIGDVLATVSVLVALALSAWALILGCALVFPTRVAISESRMVTRPWKSFGIGAGLLIVFGGIALNISQVQSPIVKLIATSLTIGLLAIAAVGAAGLANLAARRLRAMDPGPSDFQSLKMSAWIVVLSGFVPVLGWFLIGPVALLFSLGAGWQSLTAKDRQAAFETPTT